MNKRQAKKFLRTPRRQPQNFFRDRRWREATRKARGKWSPWKIRVVTLKFAVSADEVRKPGRIEQRALDDMCAQEDARILAQLEELGRTDSPCGWGHE